MNGAAPPSGLFSLETALDAPKLGVLVVALFPVAGGPLGAPKVNGLDPVGGATLGAPKANGLVPVAGFSAAVGVGAPNTKVADDDGALTGADGAPNLNGFVAGGGC